jgi:Lysozyme like domain
MIWVLAIVAFLIAGIEFYSANYSGTPGTLPYYASQAGWTEPDLSIAVAIALAESAGNASAVGDNGNSIGLWQINLPAHPEFSGDDLTDPQTNANDAFQIYQVAGNSFSPWTTFRDGRYLNFFNSPPTLSADTSSDSDDSAVTGDSDGQES